MGDSSCPLTSVPLVELRSVTYMVSFSGVCVCVCGGVWWWVWWWVWGNDGGCGGLVVVGVGAGEGYRSLVRREARALHQEQQWERGGHHPNPRCTKPRECSGEGATGRTNERREPRTDAQQRVARGDGRDRQQDVGGRRAPHLIDAVLQRDGDGQGHFWADVIVAAGAWRMWVQGGAGGVGGWGDRGGWERARVLSLRQAMRSCYSSSCCCCCCWWGWYTDRRS